jgi:hypothetical protein
MNVLKKAVVKDSNNTTPLINTSESIQEKDHTNAHLKDVKKLSPRFLTLRDMRKFTQALNLINVLFV